MLYTAEVEVLRLVFDGHLSSKTDWFSQERLAFSPYTDLKTNSTNFFSIKGDKTRYWFINAHYGGCDNDEGWLVFYSPGHPAGCSWDLVTDVKIKYSRATAATTWATGMDVIHVIANYNCSTFVRTSLLLQVM